MGPVALRSGQEEAGGSTEPASGRVVALPSLRIMIDTTAEAGIGRSTRAVVVGAGSIGARHRRVLADLGLRVRVVSRRSGFGDHGAVGEAVTSFDPGYVVIATETENHARALADLAASGFTGRVLVEKPILPEPGPVPVDGFEWIGIGYNLRFHPGVAALRSAIGMDRVLSAHARVGQYLPEWRPERDYRDTVTAGPAGGVLLELSHELDLLNWLVGPTDVLFGAAVHTGTLEIERDDLAVGVFCLPGGGLASFELNCIDRTPHRSLTMTTTKRTVGLDLLTGQLQVDGEVVYECSVARDESFAAMHRAALKGGQDVCSVAEAMTIVSQVQELRSGHVRVDAQ